MQLKVTGVKVTNKWKDKLKQVAKTNDYKAEIGFFAGGSYANGTSIPYIAYLNEYGVHNPGRPFLQRTENEKSKEWINDFGKAIKGNVNSASILRALDLVGKRAKGDVIQTITSWGHDDPRPNKDGSTPLIDSTTMVTNVKSQVKK